MNLGNFPVISYNEYTKHFWSTLSSTYEHCWGFIYLILLHFLPKSKRLEGKQMLCWSQTGRQNNNMNQKNIAVSQMLYEKMPLEGRKVFTEPFVIEQLFGSNFTTGNPVTWQRVMTVLLP